MVWCGLIAQTLKVLIEHHYHQWLVEGDNLDLWYGYEKSLNAMQRQILITHWVDSVWGTLCSPEYQNLRMRCSEKTGCLMTADGSENNKITPEGLKAYNIYNIPSLPPPLNIPSVGAQPESNLPIVRTEKMKTKKRC